MVRVEPILLVSAVATIFAVLVATACGPTLHPSAQLEELPTGKATSEVAADAVRSARANGDQVVIYASNVADRASTSALAGDDTPPDLDRSTDDEPSAPNSSAESPSPRSIVVERSNNKVTVLHPPHDEATAVAAFESTLDVLRSPSEVPDETAFHDTWNPNWDPANVELTEVAVTESSGVEVRGTAASRDDVTELLIRLTSLESFSDLEIASSQPVEEGQGVDFQIIGTYQPDS